MSGVPSATELLGDCPDGTTVYACGPAPLLTAIGMTGVLVRTGKFREADLERDDGSPAHVIDSFADLPTLLRMT